MKKAALVPSKHRLALLALAVCLSAASLSPQDLVDGRRAVILSGLQARLAVDLLGGSIVEFRLSDHAVNPLRWANEGPVGEARPMSHFLCLDRWGLPSEVEAANGMPGHGEAARVEWQVTELQPTHVRMSARLPMAGLEVDRQLWLARNGTWFHAVETVINRNSLGRVYNMVQHPTLGPPFLDETVVVDSNATRGFAQGGSLPDPEEPGLAWPYASSGGAPVSLRHLTDNHDPSVASFVIDSEIGWTTAANAARGLLIGYVWRTSEYPWLNLWRRSVDGKPAARGLEFGTTGLHMPFSALVSKGEIFGRPLLDYLDASERHTREFVGFLAKIPRQFRGVDRVKLSPGQLKLVERETGSAFETAMPPGFDPTAR